jgi:hypothetical protein
MISVMISMVRVGRLREKGKFLNSHHAMKRAGADKVERRAIA